MFNKKKQHQIYPPIDHPQEQFPNSHYPQKSRINPSAQTKQSKKPKTILQQVLLHIKSQLITSSHSYIQPNFPYERYQSQAKVLSSFVQDWINRMITDGQPVQIFMQNIKSSLQSYNDREWFDKHMTVTLAALKKKSIKPRLILPRMYIEKDDRQIKQMIKDTYSSAVSGNKRILKQLMAKNYTWVSNGGQKLRDFKQWNDIVTEINRNNFDALQIQTEFSIITLQESNQNQQAEKYSINGTIFKNNEMKCNGKKYGDTLYLLQYTNVTEVTQQNITNKKQVEHSFIIMIVLNQQSLPLVVGICVLQHVAICSTKIYKYINQQLLEMDTRNKIIQNIAMNLKTKNRATIQIILENTIYNRWLGFIPKSFIHYIHNNNIKDQNPYLYTYQQSEQQQVYQISKVQHKFQPINRQINSSIKIKQQTNKGQSQIYRAKQPYIYIFQVPINAIQPNQLSFQHQNQISCNLINIYRYIFADLFDQQLRLTQIFIEIGHTDIYKCITLFIKIYKLLQFRYRSEIEYQTQFYDNEHMANINLNQMLQNRFPFGEKHFVVEQIVKAFKEYIKSYRVTRILFQIICNSQKLILQPLYNQNLPNNTSEKNTKITKTLKYICKNLKHSNNAHQYVVQYSLKFNHWSCQCGFIYGVGLPCSHLVKVIRHFGGSLLYYINQKYRYDQIPTQMGADSRVYTQKIKKQQQIRRYQKKHRKTQKLKMKKNNKFNSNFSPQGLHQVKNVKVQNELELSIRQQQQQEQEFDQFFDN